MDALPVARSTCGCASTGSNPQQSIRPFPFSSAALCFTGAVPLNRTLPDMVALSLQHRVKMDKQAAIMDENELRKSPHRRILLLLVATITGFNIVFVGIGVVLAAVVDQFPLHQLYACHHPPWSVRRGCQLTAAANYSSSIAPSRCSSRPWVPTKLSSSIGGQLCPGRCCR